MNPREALDLVYLECVMFGSPTQLPVVEAVQVLREALENLDDIGGRYAALTVSAEDQRIRDLRHVMAGMAFGLAHPDATIPEITVRLSEAAPADVSGSDAIHAWLNEDADRS